MMRPADLFGSMEFCHYRRNWVPSQPDTTTRWQQFSTNCVTALSGSDGDGKMIFALHPIPLFALRACKCVEVNQKMDRVYEVFQTTRDQ